MPQKFISLTVAGFALTTAGFNFWPSSATPDLSGIWKNAKDGYGSIVLWLRKDGSCVWAKSVPDLRLQPAATYTVENDEIRFVFSENLNYQRMRYKIEGLNLVLNPGTSGEERLILIR